MEGPWAGNEENGKFSLLCSWGVGAPPCSLALAEGSPGKRGLGLKGSLWTLLPNRTAEPGLQTRWPPHLGGPPPEPFQDDPPYTHPTQPNHQSHVAIYFPVVISSSHV